MQATAKERPRRKIHAAAILLLILGCAALGLIMADSAFAQGHYKDVRKAVKKGPARGAGKVTPKGGQFTSKRLQIGPNAERRRNAERTPTGTGASNSKGFNSRGVISKGGFNSKGQKGFGTKAANRANGLPKGLNAKGNPKGLNTRLGNARAGLRRTFAGRQRLRADHRREILAVQRRLQPRLLPGQRGFTGVPPVSERRFRTTEMMFRVGANVSQQQIEAAARRLGLTATASQSSSLTGGTLYHFRVADGRQVADVVRALENERIGVAQPNYVYQLLQSEASTGHASTAPSEQYIIGKLRLAEIHKVATGSNVVVAVIDSQVDARHPDLAGAVVEQFDAVGRVEKPHVHGTGMAGAISAHLRLMGIAPGAKILAIHAFSTEAQQSPEATTQHILAGLDHAIAKGARVINMSFAGPYDPMLALAMKNAHDKGVVLVAAVGNAGPNSPPLYPAADPNVIAVTATDENDRLFDRANQGPQVAIAAPGVDIVAPAPNNTYQLTTGTSVAAAHVSGVAALLIERHPEADAATILEVLTASARKVGGRDRDDQYGWGLIDPESALEELDVRMKDNKVASPARPGKRVPASFTTR